MQSANIPAGVRPGRSWISLAGPGVFRLFLAAVVVLQHFTMIELGTWAVYTFFVLSGYWISVMYRKKYRFAKRPLLTFWCSRYMRLLPVYAVCLAIQLFVSHMSSTWARDRLLLRDPDWLIRTLAILTSANQRLVIGPTWSLDIEMQFYVLAPLLLFAIGRLKVRHALLAALGVTLICLALLWSSQAYLLLDVTFWPSPAAALLPWWQNQVLPRYLAFFLAGALIDRAQWRPTAPLAAASAAGWLALVVLVRVVPACQTLRVFSWDFPFQFYSSLLVLVSLPLVAFCLSQPSDSVDRHMGNLAYCVYLFHWPVFVAWQYCLSYGDPRHLLIARFLWLLVPAGSLALYYAVDQPGERLRHRFVEAQMRKPVPVPAAFPAAESLRT